MNTKIEGMAPGVPRPSSGNTPAAAAPRSGSSTAAGRVATDDSVRLSGEATDLASLERSLAEAPAIDAARVAAVRAALDTGTYQIDPQEIAARLTDLERALGA